MILIKKYNELSNKELHDIFMLRSEVFVVEQDCVYQDIDGKDINAMHFFIKDDEEVIAYLRVLEKGVSYPDSASIGRVVVSKEHRGNSYAKQLMSSAINYIFKSTTENKISISAQQYLINFYTSFGFEQVSDMYLEDDLPHVKMIVKKKGLILNE